MRERGNRNEGLTRPELAVLLAYAKLQLFDEINASSLPDDPYYLATLKAYFPHDAAKRCPRGLEQHRLRREIIGTMLDNDLVNRGGPLFMHRLKEASGVEAPALVRAYTIAVGALFPISSSQPAFVCVRSYSATIRWPSYQSATARISGMSRS